MGKKIFIMGNFTHESSFKEFEVMSNLLRSHEFVPVNPHVFYEGTDIKSVTYHELRRVMALQMLNCDVIVTMPNWEKEPINGNLKNLAHELEIIVEPFTKYIADPHAIRIG